jgi:UDP-N-acetylmuramate--alanine ligase
MSRYHFSGIAGAGMNPLARLMRARGHEVQGSDRSLDHGKNRDVAEALRRLGITLWPQDGSAVTAAVDRLAYSTAVESDTPELRAARELGIELVARPALLAEVVNAGRPGVAVAGTSGKSTITAMVGWILRHADTEATVLGGAGLVGEASGSFLIAGAADRPVVAEACESDGTLVGYRPRIGLVHNITRDHAELESLRRQFQSFAGHAARLLVNARCPEAAALFGAAERLTYGVSAEADVRLDVLDLGADRALGVLHGPDDDVTLEIPHPGLHNLENAAAAALIAMELGLEAQDVAMSLRHFPGVARRFQVIGTTASGVRVVDDFAHNGDKIRAAITTAQAGAPRIVAVFQPHGFGPARFLRAELKSLIPALLRPEDRFCYAEVFYAGGTVMRDISSAMLAADLPPELRCGYAPDHDAVRRWVVAEAKPGDTVLLMGARDPDLPRLARAVFESLESNGPASPPRG